MVTAWYNNVGGIRDLLKQVCHLSFAEKNPRDIIILTETHINHEQIHHQIHIRNNWLGPIVFSPGDSHTKGLLVLLHPVIKGITEVDTELIQKGGLCPLRLLLSPRVLHAYAHAGYSNREQLARGRFFEGLQNYMENKNEVNEEKNNIWKL